jgi:hypothetical protein
MTEMRNQGGFDDASGTSRTSQSNVENLQGGLDLISPPMVIADDIPRSTLPPIERVRFHIAVGVLIGFATFIAIPLVIWSVSVFVTENTVMTDDIIRMVTTLSAATSGLVGAVVGYYFGQNSNG